MCVEVSLYSKYRSLCSKNLSGMCLNSELQHTFRYRHSGGSWVSACMGRFDAIGLCLVIAESCVADQLRSVLSG